MLNGILKKLTPSMLAFYWVRRYPRSVSDKQYIKIIYKAIFRKNIDLNNPITFNEKLQWLKLYDRKNWYSNLVDKYEVKKIVSEKIGQQYVIPTIGVFNSFSEIDFNQLPGRFVLKCTHDSGSVILCKNKENFDINAARKKINAAMKVNYFYKSREYPYKNVKPRIIVEPYLEDMQAEQLYDYKIFCFNGKVKYLFVATDRQSNVKFDYFDSEFNKIPVRQAFHPNSQYKIQKPECFEKMKEFAEILSANIPQVRVDFYVVNGRLYFGELTFFHHGGFAPFIPEKYDYLWGKELELPIHNGELRNNEN